VLEVIFSIGIVTVGLLGTLIIIPVAGNRVTQGTIADNADRAGRNAIRQFDVMQMGRKEMWTRFKRTGNPPPPLHQYVPFGPTVAYPAFCIDPLFIATHVNNVSSNVPPIVSPKTEFFPYFVPANTEARMRRISLRKFPGASHNLNAPPAVRFQMGMPLEQAYQCFMTQDDLVFDLPDDRTLVPEQKFDSNNAKRQFDGKYTWMVTLSPKGVFYDLTKVTPNTFARTDLYTLSFVVFHRRDMSMAMHYGNPTTEGPDPERLVYADFRDASNNLTPGAGIGGGNVSLETIAWPSALPPRPHVEQDLEVRQGNWLMLSAKFRPNGNANLAPVSVFRWYRVLSADEVSGDVSNGFTRTVTLLGPDWTDVIGGQLRANALPVAQATLLNGVVAVYEKTIRLENSGMWTDL